jgi:hypothetical protein
VDDLGSDDNDMPYLAVIYNTEGWQVDGVWEACIYLYPSAQSALPADGAVA